MSKIILLRHGQSAYNSENLFAGWTDVELTSRGRVEAVHAGTKLKNMGLRFDVVFTSTLRRAYESAEIAIGATTPINDHLKNLDGTWNFTRHDDLRERSYGELAGLNRDEIAAKYGADQFFKWRRGYYDRPPGGETLEETAKRAGAYFDKNIKPLVLAGQKVLYSGHNNTLRALYVHWGFETPETIPFREFGLGEVIEVELPT